MAGDAEEPIRINRPRKRISLLEAAKVVLSAKSPMSCRAMITSMREQELWESNARTEEIVVSNHRMVESAFAVTTSMILAAGIILLCAVCGRL